MQLQKGDIVIGAFHFPDRKKPFLAVKTKRGIFCYGQFRDDENAEEFMRILADFCGAVEGDEKDAD